MADATVRRRPAPTRDELHTAIVPAGEPVIFEGAIDHWQLRSPPLSEDALAARLTEVAGERPVLVATVQPGESMFGYAGDQAEGQSFTESTHRLGSLLRMLLRGGPTRYVRSTSIRDAVPELLPLIPLELMRDIQLSENTPRLWLGGGGHRVPIHYDRDDNLFCLASGRKRFTLFPPDALPDLYVGGFGHEPGGVATALVDPLHPDLVRFPRYRDAAARAVIAELAPGDVLYLPAYWWHHVESFGLNLAITFWWNPLTPEQRMAAEAALVLGLLALRTLPPRLRAAYREQFDYLVFERAGDPYAHLEDRLQGWAGRPTPPRVRALRDKLGKLVAGAGLLGDAGAVDLDHRHTVATGVSFHLSQDDVQIRGDFFPLVVPFAVFELIREFRTPAAPRAVTKRRARAAAQRRDLERLCRALILRGILVDCEQT